MNLWEEIKTAALLGTERQPFTLSPSEGALGEMLSRLPDGSPEGRLLSVVAALALYRRAGGLPGMDAGPGPDKCPKEEQPVCSPFFAQYLALMLGGERREILPEALRLLASSRRRVPVLMLPDLLSAGAQNGDLREHILQVIGQRGQWLAAQNPDWKFAVGQSVARLFIVDENEQVLAEPALAAWQLGSRETRRGLLRQVRAQSPELGRALIESTWDSDGAEDKTAFMPALKSGLSMADEPFLEAALNSRGSTVRHAAVDLLVRLPESRLVQRMIERAGPLLKLKRGLLGKLSLDVAMPDAFDKALHRDGIEEKSPYKTLGDKAWWLTQMLGAIPPSYWSTAFSESPSKLVDVTAKCEWADAVLLGWGAASLRVGDPDWIDALARHWMTFASRPSYAAEYVPSIIDMAERAEPVILQALKEEKDSLHDTHPALHLLVQHERPWSVVLSREVVQSLQRRIAKGAVKDQTFYRMAYSFKRFAHYIPVQLAGELARDWPTNHENWPAWENNVNEFLNILQFRHDLHKEIHQ